MLPLPLLFTATMFDPGTHGICGMVATALVAKIGSAGFAVVGGCTGRNGYVPPIKGGTRDLLKIAALMLDGPSGGLSSTMGKLGK